MKKVRFFVFLTVGVFLVLLNGCASDGGTPEVRAINPMGVSSKMNGEAQALFAKARILWQQAKRWDTAKDEVCTNPLQAKELLDKAISLEPQYADAFMYRGLAKVELNDPTAFADLTAAIRLDGSAKTYTSRSVYSTATGNHKAALKDLEYAVQLDEYYTLAWLKLSATFKALGETENMCRAAQKACSQDSCNAYEALVREGLCEQ